MKKLLTALAFVSLASGCASLPPEAAAHRTALSNFTYIPDPKSDPWLAFTRIDRPFFGDCEDFAFTLQRAVGGVVFYVYTPEGTPHAVLVKGGFVFDNQHPHPVAFDYYPGKFSHRMPFEIRGVLFDNGAW